VNLCLDQNRKKRPEPLSQENQLTDMQEGQEALLYEKQKQKILDRFIKDLPERQQLALNLCFYEGLSNQEAAEIIGVNLKALQSLLMRAKITLKEKVKKYLSEA
jgi:RNA polymerase sigma-70 factor (ECF subfamily)